MPTSEHRPVSLPAAALIALRRVLSSVAALAILVAADSVLDGWPMVLVVVVVAIALLASFLRRDRLREDPQRPRDPLDSMTDTERAVGQYVPMMLSIGVLVFADAEPAVFGATIIVTVVVSMTILVWWSNRPGHAPA